MGHNTVIREDKFGLIEEVSCDNGAVVSRQALKQSIENRVNNGKSLPIKDVPDYRCLRKSNGELVSDYPYTQVLAEKVLYHVMSGLSVQKISEIRGMPSAPTIYSWTRKYPDFAAEMRSARAARAEYCHDKIFEMAESSFTKNEAQVIRAKMEAFKWLAAKNDPEEFGDKKVEFEANITYVIDTGIPQH